MMLRSYNEAQRNDQTRHLLDLLDEETIHLCEVDRQGKLVLTRKESEQGLG